MSRRLAPAFLLALLAVAAGSTPAHAQLTASRVDLQVLNAAGEPETRAGAHPDRLISTVEIESSGEERPRDMVIEFPPGMGGATGAVPLCPREQLEETDECDPESQLGRATVTREKITETESGPETEITTETLPVYGLEPAPNEAVTFGTGKSYFRMKLRGGLRSSDYGLSMTLSSLPEGEAVFGPVLEAEFEFWGVPADHQEGTSIPRRAFLTLPTRCGAPLAISMRMRTWQRPDDWATTATDTGLPLHGCPDLAFEPGLGFDLTDARVDSPSGVGFDLAFPFEPDPDRRVGSQAKDVSIALPDGMTVSPAAADGLLACGEAEFGLGSAAPPGCPPRSRVGSVEMESPQLPRPLRGTIYLGQGAGEELFRLFVFASAPGVEAKFAGALRPDPVTNRLTAKLTNLPEVTFSRLGMRFDGGPRALLATPLSCDVATALATFVPYSGTAAVDAADGVAISGLAGSRCPGAAPFEPSLVAGATSVRPGRPTSFTTTVRRRDGEQLPSRLEVGLPAGMSAALGKVSPCPVTIVDCPAESRVGATVAELGPGGSPARIHGDAFLTGPYRRAPFGLALVFRVAIGPIDLGKLVIRGALRLDPADGRVVIVTDTLPTTLRGIGVRFQTIGLDLDRPGFVRNPTSCAPNAVTATLRSAGGATHSASSPFAVRRCVELPFRPTFAMALTGASQLREDGRPGLRLSAGVPARNANMRSTSIAFPRIFGFAAAGLREMCARPEAIAGNCPAGAKVGSAFARTPLLKGPMKGAIYAVQPRGNGSPDIWAELSGSGLRINLKGETAVVKGRTGATFAGLPDFPLSTFALRFAGGEHGLFKLGGDPCTGRGRLLAPTETVGQNGVRRKTRTAMALPAGCVGRG